MFRNIITRTPLSDDIADKYFAGKIDGDSVGMDRTFVIALRALFAGRIGEDEHIRFAYTSSSRSDPEGYPVEMTVPDSWGSVNIRLHTFGGSTAASGKYIEAAEAYYNGRDGWTRLPKATEFYAKNMKVLVYACPAQKCVLILTDTSDVRKLHFLAAGLFGFFPWWFKPADGILPEEKEFCESLMEPSQDHFLSCVETIAKRLGFRDAAIDKILSGFEKYSVEAQVSSQESAVRSIETDLDNLRDRMASKLEELFSAQTMLLGLRTRMENETDSALGDFFRGNKSLVFLDGGDNTVTFAVRGYMTYWDEDNVKRQIERSGSILYTHSRFSHDDAERFYRALFVDRKVKWRTCAAFRLTPTSIQRPHPYDFPKTEFSTYLPNTHINEYGCIGNNEVAINEALQAHDYPSAIAQCIASACSFNFGDPTVTEDFANIVSKDPSSSSRCLTAFELPDGTVTTPQGVIDWLKQNEEEA